MRARGRRGCGRRGILRTRHREASLSGINSQALQMRFRTEANCFQVGWLGYSDDKVKSLANRFLGEGFTAFKIKVGKDLEDDKRRLRGCDFSKSLSLDLLNRTKRVVRVCEIPRLCCEFTQQPNLVRKSRLSIGIRDSFERSERRPNEQASCLGLGQAIF